MASLVDAVCTMTAMPINLCVLLMLAIAAVGAISIGHTRLSLVVIVAFSCQGIVVTHQVVQLMYKDIQRIYNNNRNADDETSQEVPMDTTTPTTVVSVPNSVQTSHTETDSMLSVRQDGGGDNCISHKITGYEDM